MRSDTSPIRETKMWTKNTITVSALCILSTLTACGSLADAAKIYDGPSRNTFCIGKGDGFEYIQIRRHENDICHRIDMAIRDGAVIGPLDEGWTAVSGGRGKRSCEWGELGEGEGELTYVERGKETLPMVQVHPTSPDTMVGAEIIIYMNAYFRGAEEKEEGLKATMVRFQNMYQEETEACPR